MGPSLQLSLVICFLFFPCTAYSFPGAVFNFEGLHIQILFFFFVIYLECSANLLRRPEIPSLSFFYSWISLPQDLVVAHPY